MTRVIRTLDLFHGLGGSSLGAQKAKAEIVAAIDYSPAAHKCYSVNFPNALSIETDIRKISPKNLHQRIGDIDLIVASPECTSHSCAKGARDGDEDSRLTAFEVLKFAKEFLPTWIVIENVIQMASWARYGEFIKKLKNLGYFVSENRLYSQDFGVPQSRKRLFIMCSLSKLPVIKYPKLKTQKKAISIIEQNGLYPFSELRHPKRAKATIERADRAISSLGSANPFLIVYYSSDGGGGWQTVEKPLRTITTIDRFAFVKPTENGHVMRMLQPDELKLAMGFPRTYKLFNVSRRDRIKLIGNAVCPPVMKHIVKALTAQQD